MLSAISENDLYSTYLSDAWCIMPIKDFVLGNICGLVSPFSGDSLTKLKQLSMSYGKIS